MLVCKHVQRTAICTLPLLTRAYTRSWASQILPVYPSCELAAPGHALQVESPVAGLLPPTSFAVPLLELSA